MWLRFGPIVLCVIAAGAAAWSIVPWFAIQQWAAGEQRTFQNAMAGALRGIQAGDPKAVWALCSATAAYGFFHALGPGHGKVLIGGAALASDATLKRLSILTVLSSLAQAGTAILLVGCLYFVLQIGSADLADLVDDDTAALVVQTPNFFGQLEDLDGLAESVHAAGALLIVVTDPISLGLFKPPGEYGADIAVLDGQSLGLPVSFGGPHLGVFATRISLVRARFFLVAKPAAVTR